MKFKMKGWSGWIKSPLKQGDGKKCYINDKGETVCPYVPLPKITDDFYKKENLKKEKTEKKDKQKKSSSKAPGKVT